MSYSILSPKNYVKTVFCMKEDTAVMKILVFIKLFNLMRSSAAPGGG